MNIAYAAPSFRDSFDSCIAAARTLTKDVAQPGGLVILAYQCDGAVAENLYNAVRPISVQSQDGPRDKPTSYFRMFGKKGYRGAHAESQCQKDVLNNAFYCTIMIDLGASGIALY